ncbi:glycoside hydrolase family 127 protein [Clostridium manihotivorum]|uniref:Glycoside hydrolase family 127 protein n=1 Tax=Clostridium manihotivorum TaxID=2320868 RepID=A0A3R5UFQ3_9CLOT|nr:beta-L-arabinofuranosidase domain-containing protein [Clostridium manihotivorum]QAA32625.1 glycoside hydrolase family 127 protein [Clostridium manihotivorum]
MKTARYEKLESVPLQNININDTFWNSYTRLVKEVIIPYQWQILNDNVEGAAPSHCLNNFRIAAGEKTGEFGGAVFQDTDVAKWLEAVAYALCEDRDESLEALADYVIDLIAKAQCEDGYINTYFTIKEPGLRWTNLTEGHELYTAGHLLEAAVAYYNATGKRKFLDSMIRFADLICDTFGKEQGKKHGYPGHQEIELALVKLYEVTKERKYIDTAKYFLDERGNMPNYFLEERKTKQYKLIFQEFSKYEPIYSQSHIPIRQQLTAEGHAVRATYMYCAMADIAYEYEDLELLKVCESLWNNIVDKRMYITGSIGSSGYLERFTTDYDLPNDSNYSETCASIGLALFGLRMAKITRQSKYIDIVERALYNTLLSGIGLNGKEFFYVNPLEVWPDSCLPDTSKAHVKPVRQKWFGVACCPPNIARTLASLGQYIYLVDKETIYVNLFISNNTTFKLEDKSVKLSLKTNFPNNNNFKLNINSNKDNKITLALRIPDYAENYKILINGEPFAAGIEKGYAMIDGSFIDDTLEVSFEAPAKFIYANPKVRADAGKAAIMKGPLVYCLEEVDNGENLSGILVDTSIKPKEHFEEELFGGVTTVIAKGKRISGKNWDTHRLYCEHKPKLEEITIKAIPYCYWCNRKQGEMLVWIKELLKD